MAEHPFDLLARELDAAARRQLADGAAPVRRRRRLRSRLGLGAVAATLGVSAAAWAATSLLDTGEPVAYEHGAPPRADRHYGTTVPGTVRMLADDVPDPDGGLPWGLRTFETSRGFGCLQVGRVQAGELGVLALVERGGAVRERGRFHALPTAVAAQATHCLPLDGGGRTFLALHLQLAPDATPAACRYRTDGSGMTCPRTTRTVDAGLLGPQARTVTFRHGGRTVTEPARGEEGGYLVVQRHVPAAKRTRVIGGRRRTFEVDSYFALSPGSNVIRRIAYDDGTACAVRPTNNPRGACPDAPGFTRIPQPDPVDARARVTAFAAPDRRGIRLRFRAPLAVRDGRSGYVVMVRYPHGALGLPLERDIAEDAHVRTTIDLPNLGRDHRPFLRRGRSYRVEVTYRVQPPYPRVTGSLATPGYRVGSTTVHVPG